MVVSKMKIKRTEKGKSQVDLWMETGVPQWRLSLIERGLSPKAHEAHKIASALNVDACKLFQTTVKVSGIAGAQAQTSAALKRAQQAWQVSVMGEND